MDSVLQNYDSKFMYRVPDGLRELCKDISHKVLRSQPTDIYHFIADYVDVLLITRDNTKVAINVVNNIVESSEFIINTLDSMGLDLKQIARVAPKLQQAFRDYLDANHKSYDESGITMKKIFDNPSIQSDQAQKAATTIQKAFRKYRKASINNKIPKEKMLTHEIKTDVKESAVLSKEIEDIIYSI